MWRYLRDWWQRLTTWRKRRPRRPQSSQPYRVAIFEARTAAQAAGRKRNVVAIHSSSGKNKWAYLMCPCGCGQQLALNLMPSQYPVWRVSIRTESDFSILPSVDSTTCGAHFWLRSGRIKWSELE